jgi:hypothetical protein
MPSHNVVCPKTLCHRLPTLSYGTIRRGPEAVAKAIARSEARFQAAGACEAAERVRRDRDVWR